jgi:elongation factor G
MKIYTSDKLRNVVLLGHGGSGKTSLAEAMLFDTGAVNRLGSVDEGTSVSDWDDEERRRGKDTSSTYWTPPATWTLWAK